MKSLKKVWVLIFKKVAYINSRDKEGHPLYYNIYGALKDQQMHYKILGSEENCERFLRLRVQYMEKGIKELNFEPGGTDSVVQIIDLKNSSGPATKKLCSVCRRSWMLLQDHYPELIHRNVRANIASQDDINFVFDVYFFGHQQRG